MTLKHVIQSFRGNPLELTRNIIWRFPKDKSKESHIFVVGAPRSGTTLVKSLLCAHPNLKGLKSETTTFLSYRNIFNTERHQKILAYEALSFQDFLEILHQSENLVDLYDRFAEKYLLRAQGKRFVEKTNSPTLLRLWFLTKYFPNSKIIYVIRDGRDCYCSAKMHPNVPQNNSIHAYASHWKNCVNARLRLSYCPQIFDVQYELLTSKPEYILRKIMDFLEETYDSRQIDPQYYGNALLGQTNQHRKLVAPIDASNQYRWKRELRTDEILKFQRIAGNQLQELGYELITH